MVTPHINKWDYWNYKIRETGTGTEYYFNANNKAGGTPDKVYNTNTWLHISRGGKSEVSTNSSVIMYGLHILHYILAQISDLL